MSIVIEERSQTSHSFHADPSDGGEPRGWLGAEFRRLCDNAAAVRQAMPRFIFVYLCGVYLVLALLVWWVPACDFDSMTSYLARIQLERIGPLRETGTLEIQYLFPKFFDYLHAPFLDWGWFTTLPNFALFTAMLVAAVWRLPTAVAVRFILGLAICSPVLVTVTAAKNDITLALLGMLCWFWIYYARTDRPWYLAVAMLLVSALAGTKWHGLVLAPMLAALAGIQVLRARALSRAAMLTLLLALPLAWYVSSASVYVENLRCEGTICPRPDFLTEQVSIRRNLWAFGTNNLLETFEIPFYCADTFLHGEIWKVLKWATKNGKAWNYAVMPNTHVTVYGFPLLAVIAASLAALVLRNVPRSVRACGLLSVAYCAVLLCCFRYSTWYGRYFLPTYVFGLIPFAFLARQFVLSGPWRWTFYAYLIFVSAQSTLLNQEKRLLPFTLYMAEADQFASYKTIFADRFDRDALYFHVWTGHLKPYQILRDRMSSRHRLLIVNYLEGNNVPFLYPYIRGREGYNTRIVNLRRGQAIPEDAQRDFDFVLAFAGEFRQAGFAELCRIPEIAVYENTAIRH
jgi:hypothetical protein